MEETLNIPKEITAINALWEVWPTELEPQDGPINLETLHIDFDEFVKYKEEKKSNTKLIGEQEVVRITNPTLIYQIQKEGTLHIRKPVKYHLDT